MIVALLLLAIGIASRTVGELQQHGKLKWSTMYTGFWDQRSFNRKYKWDEFGQLIKAPDTWYYRFFKIKYKERFPLSATFLVNFTDGYHLMQSVSFLCLAGSIYVFSGINFFAIWALILLVHFTVYKLLSK